MGRQVERTVMNRQHPAPAQIQVGLQALLRLHVYVGPGDVVGAGFDQGQVERPETLAYLLETVEVPGIATEEHPHIVIDDHPGRPQRPVAVQQPAPGKVL